MTKRILTIMQAVGFTLLTGCAYGVPGQEEDQPVYGHTKGPQAGDSDGGASYDYDPNNGVPYGCFVETIHQEYGQPPLFFTLCPMANAFAYKWLVDPPPDGKTHY